MHKNLKAKLKFVTEFKKMHFKCALVLNNARE